MLTPARLNNVKAPTATSLKFIYGVCAYFRDFLDTDFRRQQIPKRAISLKDQRGNLTAVSLQKYPTLTSAIWKKLSDRSDTPKNFSFSISRNQYLSVPSQQLFNVITSYVESLNSQSLLEICVRAKSNVRELFQTHQNDPERYAEAVLLTLREDLIRSVIAPLIAKLRASFERESAEGSEIAFDIEDELSERLCGETREPISNGIAIAITKNNFEELDTIIDDVTDVETVRRRVQNYFGTFRSNDIFQELHQLASTLKLRENFELYLYFCSVYYRNVAYPLLYFPINVILEKEKFHISADRNVYINKRAIEYAVQEIQRETNHPIAIAIKDRIVYLDDEETFVSVIQNLLDQWSATLALNPLIDLSKFVRQRAQRSQLEFLNTLHFAAFDKADELLLNDYEELMTLMGSGSEITSDFENIVTSFLTKNPKNIDGSIDQDWNKLPIETRLVFDSPIPLNEEQRKIIAALNYEDGRFVFVEGPPGTGKSHTITAIVFQAILENKNVLVLSDKTEALDVVEKMLNQTLSSVRFSSEFQNPILRLGKTGNTYARFFLVAKQ